MKILFLTGQLRIFGGIERVLSLKLNYLSKYTDHQIFLATYEQQDYPYICPIDERVKTFDLAINYNVDYSKESLYSLKYFKKIPLHIKRTRKLIDAIKPDLIIIPNFGFEFYFLPFCVHDIPLIREYHDSQYYRHDIKSWKYRLKLMFDSWIEKKYSAIVLLTESERSFFKHKDNIVIIPNPIEKLDIVAGNEKKIVITAGRLDPVKGFDSLIDIWESIDSQLKDEWQLHIYGKGSETYKRLLQKKIMDLNLAGSVFLKGVFTPIYQKFTEAKLFVCTSRTESFGLALVEAQACGLPVVSFDCPYGPGNIIHSGEDGYLIPDFSKEHFRLSLVQLMRDDELRKKMSENAVKNASLYDKEIIMKTWLVLFSKLIMK